MTDSTTSRSDDQTRNIAVLIDGDNAQPSLISDVLAEVAKYGTITVRRAYGDWTTQSMSGWKVALHEGAFQPQQQFAYTTGKNATDSALIIDAMDLLYSGVVDGFCIVSSDSDFTRLATRIREQGLFVMGIGGPETPKSFVNACEVFVHTTNLVHESSPAKQSGVGPWQSKESRQLDPHIEDGDRGCGWRRWTSRWMGPPREAGRRRVGGGTGRAGSGWRRRRGRS